MSILAKKRTDLNLNDPAIVAEFDKLTDNDENETVAMFSDISVGNIDAVEPALGYLFDTYNNVKSEKLLTWADLIESTKAPLAVTKNEANCFAAQLTGVKSKASITEHGKMSCLWQDVDKNDVSIEDVQQRLEGAGVDSAVIFSSASSMRWDYNHNVLNGKRWRVLIPLAAPISIGLWLDIQQALMNILEGDTCCSRVAQISFMPNNPEVTEDSKSKGSTRHYECKVIDNGSAIDGDNLPANLLKLVEEQQQETAKIAKAYKATPKIKRDASEASIIEMVTANNDLLEVIDKKGYLQSPKDAFSFQPTTATAAGSYGFKIIRDQPDKWLTFHTSADIGHASSKSDTRFGDVFDVICYHEYNNDRKACLKAMGDLYDPKGQKTRQQDHMKTEEAKAIDEAFNNTDALSNALDNIKSHSLVGNIEKIDLSTAPGLVGEVISYINACSRYPREKLAVSAALSVVSNIGGLRFEDVDCGATPNLLMFNVAGSATGKEAIQQSANRLMNLVGLSGVGHGTIKSEQEIYRNITRHQMAAYSIDELGILLQKIDEGSKGGSASYLGGVIGALISLFSKADGFCPLGGDVALDLLKENNKEAAALQKLVDEEEASTHHTERLESLRLMSDQLQAGGIDSPYLSVQGYTTPSTFNSLMTYAQATAGFIGRALIFEEADNNPRMKKGFKKPSINGELEANLHKLRCGGIAQTGPQARIEFYGDKAKIYTDKDALALLDTILDDLWEQAARAMESTGLEAIVRRSYEAILKVSMVLAMGDKGLRTVEHVKWAYKLVKQDLQNKILLTAANMAENEDDIVKEVKYKVLHKLDKKVPNSLGAIKNKLRKTKEEHIQKILDHLVEVGRARTEWITPKRGPQSLVYYKK